MTDQVLGSDEKKTKNPQADFSKTAAGVVFTDLISQSSMDEAKQHLIGLSGFFGFRLVHNAHHFINAFRQQGKALHFVDIVPVLISFSSPVKREQKKLRKD